jgi:chromosome segregation ATPase
MQHIQKSILVFKPDYLESNTGSDAALSLFNRDARMHILKCKQDENRNKILRNRIFIRKQSQSNPHLEDIVNRYDDYYEEFKNKIVMQIGALERLLKYLKDLETSKHKTHHHQHHHYHHYDKRRDEYEERHEQIENDQEYQGENVKASGKKKVPRAIVAGIKRDQQMIFKEIRKLKNALLMKGSNREAKYKELSKYIDGIDGDANKTDNNLFKIKRDQEQILQTLGKITRDVEKFD